MVIYSPIYGCFRSLSHVQLFVTPWTIAYQALLSMGFPRQEDWRGLPLPSPGDLLLYFTELTTRYWASLVSQLVKNPPAMQETPVQYLGWEDLLEKG